MLEDDTTAGETFELYGPNNYSMAEIAQLVDREIIKHRRHLNIPKRMMKPIAKILNQLIYWKTTSADEVEREFIDQVIDPKAKTFKDLDIEPGDVADFTFQYLVGLWSMLTTIYYPVPYCFTESWSWTLLCSKITEVHRSTIFQRQRSGRNERKRNICMFLMISRVWMSRTIPEFLDLFQLPSSISHKTVK